MKVVLNSVMKKHGEQCVMILGVFLMPTSSVVSLVSITQVKYDSILTKEGKFLY